MSAEGGRWAAAVVALGILVLIGAMSVTAIVKYDTPEQALEIWTAVTGLLGVVTGAVVAYFFTRGQVETARESAQNLKELAATAQEQEAGLMKAREDDGQRVRENKDALTVCMSRIDPALAQDLEQDPVVARALGRRP
jgi:uncharacterized integral membrane protein